MDCIKLFAVVKPYKLAKLLNIPLSTVYSWKKNGIPKWRILQIMEVANKSGLDLSDCVGGAK